MASNLQTMDSLIANEFAFEIAGEKASGVFGVRNFVTYACDDEGNRVKPAFEVLKMVQRDPNNAFNTWLRETLDARESTDRPRRDVTIVAVDDGIETRRWSVKNAWIQKIHYTDFDSSSFEMVAEIFTIQYDDIEETFPAE
jgi:hypothetical protein